MDLEIEKKKTRTQTKPARQPTQSGPHSSPARPVTARPRSQQAARFPDLTHRVCVPSRAHNSALAAPSRGRAPAHALSPNNPGPACQPRSEHARQRRADTLAPALCNRPTLAHRSTPTQPAFAPVRLTSGPHLSAPLSRKPRPRLSRCAPGPARQRHSRAQPAKREAQLPSFLSRAQPVFLLPGLLQRRGPSFPRGPAHPAPNLAQRAAIPAASARESVARAR